MFKLGIQHVTFWISSITNLRDRPANLVKATNKLYAKKFNELLNDPSLMENEIKVKVYGRWKEMLDENTARTIEEIIHKTSENKKATLTLLLAYDGKMERGEAVLSLLKDQELNKNVAMKDAMEAEGVLRSYAWTGDLPDVDLIIRTGSFKDPHNSADFLSFLTGNTQFVFPDIYWPDFNLTFLQLSLNDFLNRERRKGK